MNGVASTLERHYVTAADLSARAKSRFEAENRRIASRRGSTGTDSFETTGFAYNCVTLILKGWK